MPLATYTGPLTQIQAGLAVLNQGTPVQDKGAE